MPRTARALVGIVALVAGAVLLVRPTSSLDVLAWLIGAGLILTGVAEFFTPSTAESARWRFARTAAWLAAGVLVWTWPGLTVRLLAAIVGSVLIVDGLLSIVSSVRTRLTLDARVAGVALAVAELVLGVLALAWPDITLLVVAVVFGARLVLAGIRTIWNRSPEAPVEPSGFRRWTRTIGALAALSLALGAAAVSAVLQDASPVVDDFYMAPRGVTDEPGQLIRSEPFTRGIPANATAWRILYTTSRGDGSAAIASGLVVVPRDGDGPWPVVDWAHGTTGYSENCAPSLAKEPFESGAFFLLDQVLANGWAVVSTDYIGLGTEGPHPYLIGPDTAHATLDAARAAKQLDDAHLGDQNVVWGHSQGGAGALWTGALADQYAPDVDVVGVAALAPASNLSALVDNLPDTMGGSLFASYVFAAYHAVYGDVSYRDYIRPGAQLAVREMARRCLAEPAIFVSILNALALAKDPEIFSRSPLSGPLGRHVRDNIPPPGISAPLLLAQGGTDRLVIRSSQDQYVDDLCAAGQQVDYRVYSDRGHVPLVEPDSPLVPDLLAWTHDRLGGNTVAPGCLHRER